MKDVGLARKIIGYKKLPACRPIFADNINYIAGSRMQWTMQAGTVLELPGDGGSPPSPDRAYRRSFLSENRF